MNQLKKSVQDKKLSLVKILSKSVRKQEVKETMYDIRLDINRAYFSTSLKTISGHNVNRLRMNILHIAALDGNTSMVRAILDAFPALINTKTSDEMKLTAIQIAAISGHDKLTCFLTERGASLAGVLVYCMASVSTHLTSYLLHHGASADDKNSFIGTTPLFYAYTPGLVKELIRAGANVNHRDTYGWTPLMYHVKMFENSLSYPSRRQYKKESINELLANGASIGIKGRNRDLRYTEGRISLLHIAASTMRPGDPHMLDFVSDLFVRNTLNLNAKTSLGNTPALYYLKTTMRETPVYEVTLRHAQCIVFNLKRIESKGGNLKLRDIYDCTVRDIIRKYVTNRNFHINIDTVLRNFVNEVQPKSMKIKNLYIPSNMNTTDPVLLNNINKNNAYLIKTDLVSKNVTINGKTKRVRELRTVYNKSSLNGILNSGRSLVSPLTRKPFRSSDIVKLTDVAPASQLKKYKRNSR